LPADVLALGEVRYATSQESVGTIPAAEAVAAAAKEGFNWPDPDAFLVVITESPGVVSDIALKDSLVWLIRWDDLELTFTAPSS
jgi:hypothetical protein